MVVGSVELVPLLDAVGELGELAELFPETSDWSPYRELYPELFAGSQWRLPCKCYLVRSAGVTMLVDTGVGPAGLWGWEAESEEGLLPALAAAGVTPDAVDVVFLTHLHVDHVGWNTDGEGRPVFPNARYVTHRDGLELVRADPRGHVARTVLPLTFDELDSETTVANGVVAVPLPGHLAGHMGLRIESDGERAILIGDTAVNPMLLNEPDHVYRFDQDSPDCAATRRGLLPELVDQDVLVVCGHYPGGGIGRVVTRDGMVVWEAAA